MTEFQAMERESYGSDEEVTGWRSFWMVRWTKTKIVNPLMVILRRYFSCLFMFCFLCGLSFD